jgi:hypothetical protein
LWAKIKRDMAPTYGHVIGTTWQINFVDEYCSWFHRMTYAMTGSRCWIMLLIGRRERESNIWKRSPWKEKGPCMILLAVGASFWGKRINANP